MEPVSCRITTTNCVTVYEVRTSRVPRALFWRSSLYSMSIFDTRIHQRYVMQTDHIYGYEKDSHNNRTQQQNRYDNNVRPCITGHPA
jgi:hypothetical protein